VYRRDFAAHSALRKRHKIALPMSAGGGVADANFLPNRWQCSRLGVATTHYSGLLAPGSDERPHDRCDLCPECGQRGRRCG
jgi:hypothetical protein